MSIFGALYSAVSGLTANSNALGIISDNIANSNTVGYKETSTDFSSLVTTNNAANSYSPGGVLSSPFYNIDQQGTLQSETSPTDLAISGGGFFIVNGSPTDTDTMQYTRAGDFSVDANGNLVNSAGLYLQGQPLTYAQSQAIAQGNIDQLSATTLSSLQTVNVTNNAGTAQATGNVDLVANLPADDTSTPETITTPVYDSLGVAHQMTLSFTPTGTANQWSVSASLADAPNSTVSLTGGNIVQFNTDGSLEDPAPAGSGPTTFTGVQISWGAGDSNGASPQNIDFNLGTDGETNGLSQIGDSFTVGQLNQDGVQFGSFSGVTIDKNGIVYANYDNGLTRAIYMLPLATFESPDGLEPVSGNAYQATNASGSVLLRQAGIGNAGAISPSTLENSTVDIATEFSNMIITQRAYEANSRVITTADQMLQTLTQIQ